jgi:transposase
MLTDQQWGKIEPLLRKLRKSKRGGRPWVDSRRVLEGILWIARSGAGGRIFLPSIRHLLPAGGAYMMGNSAGFG